MDASQKRAWAIGVGGTLAMWLLWQVKVELHPLAGLWEPVRITYADGSVEKAPEQWRLWLDVEPNGLGQLATYWTCGAVETSFGDGIVRVNSKSVDFHTYAWATRTTDEKPHLSLPRLPNGNLAFNYNSHDGPIIVELERTRNAPTVLDYVFFWR